MPNLRSQLLLALKQFVLLIRKPNSLLYTVRPNGEEYFRVLRIQLKGNLAASSGSFISWEASFQNLRSQKPNVKPSEWIESFGNAALRKRNQSADTRRALRGSVTLTENADSSRQVADRRCPQILPKPHGKKRTFWNTSYE